MRGLGFVGVAALRAGLWALATSSGLCPAILLGVATVMVLKHGARQRWHRGCSR